MPHGKEKKKVKSFTEHMDLQETVVWHLENDIPLGELYRVGSMRYYQVFNEAREMWREDKINLTGANLWFVESDIGYFAEHKGEMVPSRLSHGGRGREEDSRTEQTQGRWSQEVLRVCEGSLLWQHQEGLMGRHHWTEDQVE